MRILSVLHPGGGHSGLLRERAAQGGHELLEWTPAGGGAPPAPLPEVDGLAVFGGGMNVVDRGRLTWLEDEIALLRAALAAGTPVLGVCLGAQLLAAAAGAPVRRARRPEIGWHEVRRTPAGAADPVLGGLPERFTAYGWHSWTFALPPGAVELARSVVCPQAYELGGRAWGVQYHPEVTPDILEEWIGDWRSDPDAVRQGFDPDAARAELPAGLEGSSAVGRLLFDAWLTAVAGVRAPA
jgi:GMP synthase (glutamine-hydrolysing)